MSTRSASLWTEKFRLVPFFYFEGILQAPLSFRRRIMALSVCLPNVYLAEQEYDTDSAGDL